MNDKFKNAIVKLNELNDRLWKERKQAKEVLKAILEPCGNSGCLVGTEDYADDIYYLWGEEKPNKFDRVLAVRYNINLDEIEVSVENENEWIDIDTAHIEDLRFLVDEITANLEYSDGYQDDDADFVVDEFKYLIDEDGSKYNPETSILSGGMDIRCDYNEEALFAYKTRDTLPQITEYLLSKGWVKTHGHTYHEFVKGNTACFFDDWNTEAFKFACFGTEYRSELPDAELASEEKPVKRYAVPYLRSQWADVYVDATSPEEAIEKAEKVFRESHDGWIEWEDVDTPELDRERGVKEI